MSRSILDISDPSRRTVLRASAALSFTAALPRALQAAAPPATGPAAPGPSASTPAAPAKPQAARLGFAAVPVSTADGLRLPEGYRATVLAPWGEPVGVPGQMPAWAGDASQGAAEQALQMGMHHDGLQYLPLNGSSQHGLLVVNHEYVDDGLLHADGAQPWTSEKVAKSQAAHGLSVIEVARREGRWVHVAPSRWARRITAQTPMAIGGPAAGHPLMRTAADPAGQRVLGTFNNCALSLTPWGTVLSGEENFDNYFISTAEPIAPHHQRWGIGKRSWYRWHEFDERFDATRHPNEPNRFGWIVELDPQDPTAPPVKRTALGRACHEGGWAALTRGQRAVVYSTEDAAFEYLYKFVSRDRMRPGGAAANRQLLDHGTLHVALFEPGGRGRWLPLVQGQGPLTADRGFADTAEVLIKARQASDALGATPMDRPEWVAVDAESRWVYCSLTNNRERGRPGRAGADAANPRAENIMGHIIRWRDDGDLDGLGFEWEHVVLCGDPAQARPEWQGSVRGDMFACPDGLAIGPGQVLWTCTDMGSSASQRPGLQAFGNNALLACDPQTGAFRRFMTGPVNAEFTGVCFAPDGRTLFVSVQHPGEAPQGRNDPKQPDRWSNWPAARAGQRPRSAIVAVQRDDGGLIGLG